MKFKIDHRYNLIMFNWFDFDQIYEIEKWCAANGQFKVYSSGIVYDRERDLTAFLLKWS